MDGIHGVRIIRWEPYNFPIWFDYIHSSSNYGTAELKLMAQLWAHVWETTALDVFSPTMLLTKGMHSWPWRDFGLNHAVLSLGVVFHYAIQCSAIPVLPTVWLIATLCPRRAILTFHFAQFDKRACVFNLKCASWNPILFDIVMQHSDLHVQFLVSIKWRPPCMCKLRCFELNRIWL